MSKNISYKGRDAYNLEQDEIEYFTPPCCRSNMKDYGTGYGPICPNFTEAFNHRKGSCSCYGNLQKYGKSQTCNSNKNPLSFDDQMKGVI